MITGIYQSLMMLFGIVPFYITDTYFHHKYDSQREQNKSGRNWWIIFGSGVIGMILFLQPILWPRLSFYTDAHWGLILQLFGVLLMLGAAGLNYWARYHLGIFYVQGSETQENHQLIDTGPYALVRHPLFTTYFMIIIGMLCCNPSVITILLLIGAIFYFRMWTRLDEDMLIQELPDYEAYMRRTNRFIPTPSAMSIWFKHQYQPSHKSSAAD